jgi:hypothetical protein
MNRIRVTEHRKTTEHKIHFTYSWLILMRNFIIWTINLNEHCHF